MWDVTRKQSSQFSVFLHEMSLPNGLWFHTFLPSKQKISMQHLFKIRFALGVLDKTPMLAMPVFYVHLYQIIYDMGQLLSYYSGRAASRLGRDSTSGFKPLFVRDLLILLIPDPCAPSGNKTTKSLAPQCTIRQLIYSEFNGSLFSFFIFILTLTHLLIAMVHRKRALWWCTQ
jgi:hypothetical protein